MMPSNTTPEMENVTMVTLVWVDTGYAALTARVLFILTFTLLGFIGNLLILVAVIRSRTFRTSTFNLTILNIVMVNLLQCVLLGPYVITTTITEMWLFGDIMCNIISFLFMTLNLAKVLAWLVVTLERLLVIRGLGVKHVVVTQSRLVGFTSLSWLYCIVFCMPILFNAIPSEINTTKYFCSFEASASIVYTLLLCLCCLLLPLTLTAVLYVIVWKTGVIERRKVRDVRNREKFGSNREKFGSIFMNNDAPIKKEMSVTKYSIVLFVLWLILELPLIVLVFVQQFHSAIESNYHDVRWYVQFPSVLDTVFTWMLFSYTTLFPCVFLFVMKDIQQKLKQQLMCRQNNSVTDLRQAAGSSIAKIDLKIQEQVSTPGATPFNIPVLFATSKGIQLKTYRNDGYEGEASTPVEKKDAFFTNNSQTNTETRKCDVLTSYDFVRYDDTSDYDSNDDDLDPYSVSHPITTKSNLGSKVKLHKRSTSDPDVDKIQTKKSKSQKHNLSNLNRTSGMDSGIDVRRSDDSLYDKSRSEVKMSRASQETNSTILDSTTSALGSALNSANEKVGTSRPGSSNKRSVSSRGSRTMEHKSDTQRRDGKRSAGRSRSRSDKSDIPSVVVHAPDQGVVEVSEHIS